jgi:DNA-directed RNA polymerase specialized sigma24 family protein
MHHQKDLHTESALYWSAVSLIVCEGLSVGAAAQRLGIENGRLRNILRRRRRSVTETRHVDVGLKADPQPDTRRT